MHTDLRASTKLQLGMREINVFTPKVMYSLQRQHCFVFVSEILTLCLLRLCISVCVFVYFFYVPGGPWLLKCEDLPHKSVNVHPPFSTAAQSLGRTAGLWMSSGPPPPGTDSRSEPDTHQTGT